MTNEEDENTLNIGLNQHVKHSKLRKFFLKMDSGILQ